MTATWWSSAIHEAGHAVSHWVYRHQIVAVAVFAEPTGEILGRCCAQAPSGYPPMQQAVCCLAGLAAESRVSNVPIHELGATTSMADVTEALNAMAKTGKDCVHLEGEYRGWPDLSKPLKLAQWIVAKHWRDIELVAWGLLEKPDHILDRVEVAQLLQIA
jgi:hypothetical protein